MGEEFGLSRSGKNIIVGCSRIWC